MLIMQANLSELRENDITGMVIDCAIKVHRALGPGLLESAYEECLFFELAKTGLRIERQKALPLMYEEVKLDAGYRVDMMINSKIIVEIKAVDALHEVHMAQLLTYLKLSGCKVGLLINFNVSLLKEGIRRVVNKF